MMPDIAIAFLVCLVLAIASRHLALPPVPFYIAAGLVLGTSGLSIVHPGEVSEFLTHAGLLFLLFTMGLELKPAQVASRGRSLLRMGTIDLSVNFCIGFAAALLLGLPIAEAAVIAAAFYISSSAMALASLIENKRLILREAETVVWLMIFEDIVLVGFFILLSAKTTHPLVQIGAIALAVGGIFLLVRLATGPIRALLNRDDDLPLLFTFGIVIGAALFAAVLGIPSEIVAIAAGSALSLTSPASLERYARPFRDVFLVLFFVFFGISVDLAGSIPLLPLIGLSLLAIASKLISAFAIGKGIHGSAASGIEIWSHTASRGEFSIALAAIYGSATVSATVAALVVLTSVAGAFLGRYSIRIRKILVRARRAAQ